VARAAAAGRQACRQLVLTTELVDVHRHDLDLRCHDAVVGREPSHEFTRDDVRVAILAVDRAHHCDVLHRIVAIGVCRDRRAAKTQVFDESQRSQEGVGQPAPRALLRARGLGQPRSSASGSHVLVTRCVWRLPDQEFTLSLGVNFCCA
jgi:hypothetical protein